MRSKADETFVIVETLICPLQMSPKCFDYSKLSMMYRSMIRFPSESKELQLIKILKTLFLQVIN